MDEPRKRFLYDWIVEISSLLLLIWCFFPLFNYNKIEDGVVIPIHYNLNGDVDGWGEKYFLFVIAFISLVFYVGFIFLEKYYCRSKCQLKATKENTNRLYRLRIRLGRHLKFFSIFIFAYLNNSSYSIAVEGGDGFNKIVINILLIGVICVVSIYYIMMLYCDRED